jgi:hypothetical protein
MLANAVLQEAEPSFNLEFMINLWKPQSTVPKISKLENNSTKKQIKVLKSTSPKKNKSNVTSNPGNKKEQNLLSEVKSIKERVTSSNPLFSRTCMMK